MTTQVMDPSTSQRNWTSTSYLMGGRSHGNLSSSPSRIVTGSTMAPSTYVSADVSLPSFSNPFLATSRPSTDIYMDAALDSAQPTPHSARTSISSASSSQYQYGHSPVSAAAAASPIVGQPIYGQSFLNQSMIPADFAFSTAPSPVNPAFAQESFDIPSGSFLGPSIGMRSYNNMGGVVNGRRSSQPSLSVTHITGSQDVFGADQDTPRGPYAPSHRGRGSADSYNFPSTHSSTSSISSSVGSNFSHYGSPMEGSALSDYSDVEVPMQSAIMRTSQPSIMSNAVPAQASMMTQFSSKVSSSVQKKHVCKICEKRFTRPSSLQTHVYSHTGEKPYQCNHPGCGRCFSVVSNLRRHQKIHRSRDFSADPMDSRSEAGSDASHITDGDE